jgi:hypothetical protein
MLTKESKYILVSNLMYKIKDHLRKLPKHIREVEVTEDWIYETMEKNNWSCPIMKVKFPMIPNGRISRTQYKELGINKLKMASVDRKDSSKGYTKENTQIVCRFLNLGKTDNPNEDALELLNEFKNSI